MVPRRVVEVSGCCALDLVSRRVEVSGWDMGRFAWMCPAGVSFVPRPSLGPLLSCLLSPARPAATLATADDHRPARAQAPSPASPRPAQTNHGHQAAARPSYVCLCHGPRSERRLPFSNCFHTFSAFTCIRSRPSASQHLPTRSYPRQTTAYRNFPDSHNRPL